MDISTIERIAALVVLCTSAIVAAFKIPDIVVKLIEARKRNALARETSLGELLDGYVERIVVYEHEKQVANDRIAALEKTITERGLPLPPLGRRRSDRITKPLPVKELHEK
jgi:hypothetical protein